ncbi:type IV conjugative transfer system protein TraE [Massilia sp. YMA4]|uniref:Type IV conjugative transfer system protein TraE n=1 Tax=[Empedobacter] haloabium TaxID=592317 RepID=A0ABZ1US20_9BURK|nr:type IV conjugative transfer system protein TraE [Massilia sp. YMA4]AXA91336.1 type IV conjugative transfer system protein TraE [Massilia sp. YMA4]
MRNDDYEATLSDLRRAIRSRSTVIGMLSAALLLALSALYHVIGTERTIVSPPNLTGPFSVKGDKYSNAYLEQMGGYVAWLILDVAPSSLDWKKNALLGFVAPDLVGKLKQRQEIEAARLKRLNASTYFLPRQLVPDEEHQRVRIIGLLRTQINGQDTPPVPKTYEATFASNGGRLHLTGFEEVKDHGKSSLAGADAVGHIDDGER